jgi:heterodisulfide reductase subunit A-like polyferredoxin
MALQKVFHLKQKVSLYRQLTKIQVIVVGAGPSGLLLALLLSKQGIHVQVLEAAELSTLNLEQHTTHLQHCTNSLVLECSMKSVLQVSLLT